jgi:hypothetical protein
MIPFVQFHALAATRGEGLRPEFLDLFKRQAEQAFINRLRSNDDAEQESKVNRLSQKNSPRERGSWWTDDRPTR